MLKNRIHAEFAKRAIRPGRPLWSREGRELLRGLGLEAVDQVMPVMATLDRQIAKMSLDLRRMCGENPRARLLTTIPSVGYYIALLLVSEIGDVRRFPDSEAVQLRWPGAHGEAEWRQHPPWRHHTGGFQVAQVGADPGGARSPAARDEPDTVLRASGC